MYVCSLKFKNLATSKIFHPQNLWKNRQRDDDGGKTIFANKVVTATHSLINSALFTSKRLHTGIRREFLSMAFAKYLNNFQFLCDLLFFRRSNLASKKRSLTFPFSADTVKCFSIKNHEIFSIQTFPSHFFLKIFIFSFARDFRFGNSRSVNNHN